MHTNNENGRTVPMSLAVTCSSACSARIVFRMRCCHLVRPETRGHLDPSITGDPSELRHMVTDLRTIVHNEYLGRLLRKLQIKKPDSAEWTDIKQKLRAGKCLASTCSLCSAATISESLEALSHGMKTDCGGSESVKCSDIFTCSSCRQSVQGMEDTLSRFLGGSCKSGHCGSIECSGCRQRLAAEDSSDSSHEDDEDNDLEDDRKYCLEDDCAGIKTCMLCRYEKNDGEGKASWRSP